MKIFLWSLSFVFLVLAAVIGVGASIGLLQPGWFAVCLFCAAGVFSSAEYADSIKE